LFKLFKKIIRPKVEVNLGKISSDVVLKRKRILKNENQFRVTKINGKTQYYSIDFGKSKSKTLHLSLFGKKLFKKYPEVIDFINKNVFNSKTIKNYSLNTDKLNISLARFKKSGYNNKYLLKMNLFLKKEGVSKNYFLKMVEAPMSGFLANNEFIANQAFQKYGINTIKPHIAFTDNVSKKSIIAYDFTGLKTMGDAYLDKEITTKELKLIEKKIDSLSEYKFLPISVGNKRGIGDFERMSNVFVKRVDGKIEVYFTDLLIGTKSRMY